MLDVARSPGSPCHVLSWSIVRLGALCLHARCVCACRCGFPSLVRYTLSLAQKVDLIDALKEIKLQEGDTSFLAPEYAEVVKDGAKFKREFQNQPRALEMLYGLVTDLYVDKEKFRGRDVQHRIPALVSLLQRYNFEDVVRFFDES